MTGVGVEIEIEEFRVVVCCQGVPVVRSAAKSITNRSHAGPAKLS